MSSRNSIAFKTIVRKEVVRFMRIWTQTILPSAITTTLYFIIFGNLIGSKIEEMGGIDYIDFIVPGLIMMSIINNSFNNVVSSFFGAKFQRFIDEMLVSPMPNHIILNGFLVGGILRGLIVGVLVTGVSACFTPLQIKHPFIMFSIAFLTALLFSLGGFINAIFSRKFDDISIIPTFFLTPLTYLGGVFYSINLLPLFWQKVSMLNPLLHIVNAFRYSFLGQSDVSIAFALSMIIGCNLVFYFIALTLLNKGVGLRS